MAPLSTSRDIRSPLSARGAVQLKAAALAQ